MIRIVYDRPRHRLTITGHAGAGPKGQDVVCAAASMLACTLVAAVDGLVQTGAAADPVIKREPGAAEISCRPCARMQSVVEVVYGTVCTGFQLLAEQYPEHVKFSQGF